MRLRLAHSLGVIALVAIYALAEVSDFSVKEAFYAKLHAVVDSVPESYTLIVLGDFIATTGIFRDGYETCVSPHAAMSFNQC